MFSLGSLSRVVPLFLISAFLVVAAVRAQADIADLELEWAHPRPAGNSLRAVVYREGVFVTSGWILRSEDGAVWEKAEVPVPLPAVRVVRAENGFLAAGAAGIWESADGREWTSVWENGTNARRLTAVAEGENGRVVAVGWELLAPPEMRLIAVAGDAGSGWGIFEISADGGETLDLAFGAGKFVAIVRNGAGEPGAYFSEDGDVWTAAGSPATDEVRSLTFGLGKFWAVGNNGSLWSSADGDAWVRERFLTDRELLEIDFNEGRFSVFGAGAAGGVSEFSSEDGVVWSETEYAAPANLRGFVNGDGVIVGVGDGGTIARSLADGSWETVSERVSTGNLSAIAYGNGKYVAVGGVPPEAERWTDWRLGPGGDRTILVSDDGENWEEVATAPGAKALYTVAYGNGTFVAAGAGGAVATSEDGMVWTERDPDGTATILAVLFDGERFVANRYGNGVLISSDGIDWQEASPMPRYLEALTWNGEIYVGMEQAGNIHVTRDFRRWEVAPSFGSNLVFYSLAFNNGLFVAVGGESRDSPTRGRIYTSANGLVWSQVAVDFPVPLTGVTAYGNGFVAVGGSPFAAGYVFVSADGVNWEAEPVSIIRDSLWGVAAVNGELMAVGDNGAILRSAGERYPQIVEQPRRAAAMPGAEVVFSAEVTGEEPLVFQWYRDDEPVSVGERISGATTAVLRLADVTEADAGVYHLAVASGEREVTSFAVSLVVAPYFTVNPMAGPATPGWRRTVFKTIQEGIEAVGSLPMEVRVMEGNYLENIVFRGKPAMVTSADPERPSLFVIDGMNRGGPTVNFGDGEDSRSVLRGFTVKSGTPGVAVVGGSPTIEKNSVQGNVLGGIRVADVSPGETGPLIRGNEVFSNSASSGGGITVVNASATIENNVVSRTGGVGISVDGLEGHRVTLINNTSIFNTSHGLLVSGSGEVEVVNSIFARNFGGGIVREAGSEAAVSARYSNVWMNMGGDWVSIPDPTGSDGNLRLDPFMLQDRGRVASRATNPSGRHSPMIDAGDPASDFSREPEPNGGRINIGAFGNTATASKSIALPVVSKMTIGEKTWLVRSGEIGSALPVAVGVEGDAVPDEDFRMVPSPLGFAPGEDMFLVRATEIPGILAGEISSVTMRVAEAADYFLNLSSPFTLAVEPLAYNDWLRSGGIVDGGEGFGPGEDPGGRGIANLLRFAFGMDWGDPERGNLPRAEVREIGEEAAAEGFLCLTFVWRPEDSGLRYVVESSGDLRDWAELEGPEVVETVSLGDGLERVTVRDERPAVGAARFLRVRVEME